MKDLLHNPVYHALLTGDGHLSFGNDYVKFYDEQVAPFAGFEEGFERGFSDLHEILPSGRKIVYATPLHITQPVGWQLVHEIEGLQFVYVKTNDNDKNFTNIKPLTEIHVPQMMELTKLTKPGPFESRTINFGYYYGIFENDKLVAMTGQRMHVANFTEISAVCTHPDHLGKGYAYSLMQHQLQLILQQGNQPFLHVRDNNLRAIELYQRLGFTISRTMNFYFMKRG